MSTYLIGSIIDRQEWIVDSNDRRIRIVERSTHDKSRPAILNESCVDIEVEAKSRIALPNHEHLKNLPTNTAKTVDSDGKRHGMEEYRDLDGLLTPPDGGREAFCGFKSVPDAKRRWRRYSKDPSRINGCDEKHGKRMMIIPAMMFDVDRFSQFYIEGINHRLTSYEPDGTPSLLANAITQKPDHGWRFHSCCDLAIIDERVVSATRQVLP